MRLGLGGIAEGLVSLKSLIEFELAGDQQRGIDLLAMHPDIGDMAPAATSFLQSSKVAGIPTAATMLPSTLLIVSDAPNFFAMAKRLLSRSIMMICAGE